MNVKLKQFVVMIVQRNTQDRDKMSKSKHQIEELKKDIEFDKRQITLLHTDIKKKQRKIRHIEHPYLKEG